MYTYLDDMAAQLVQDVSKEAATATLDTRSLIPLGDNSSLWFTWTGTKIQRMLWLMSHLAEPPRRLLIYCRHAQHIPNTGSDRRPRARYFPNQTVLPPVLRNPAW